MKRLALLGASGHGKVLAEIAELMGYETITFFDDNWPEKQSVGRWDVIGNTKSLLAQKSSFDGCVLAIGDNQVRAEKHSLLASNGIAFATLIHPSSVISQGAKVSEGVVIMAGAIINVDVIIGLSSIINTGAIVDHDSEIGDFAHVSPGACVAGNVSIGSYSWVGIGAIVRQGISIASRVVVGAGAVVVSNVLEGLVVVGVPAKVK